MEILDIQRKEILNIFLLFSSKWRTDLRVITSFHFYTNFYLLYTLSYICTYYFVFYIYLTEAKIRGRRKQKAYAAEIVKQPSRILFFPFFYALRTTNKFLPDFYRNNHPTDRPLHFIGTTDRATTNVPNVNSNGNEVCRYSLWQLNRDCRLSAIERSRKVDCGCFHFLQDILANHAKTDLLDCEQYYM